jgi:hypothetical protein
MKRSLFLCVFFICRLCLADSGERLEDCSIVSEKPLKVKCENYSGYLDGDFKIDSVQFSIKSKSAKFTNVLLENISIDDLKNRNLLRELISKKIDSKDFDFQMKDLTKHKVVPLYDKNKKIVTGCEFKSVPMLAKFNHTKSGCNKTFCIGPATCGSENGEYQYYLACEAKASKDDYTCPNTQECFDDNSFSSLEHVEIKNYPIEDTNSGRGISR